METKSLESILECAVDKHGLSTVLGALVAVCHGKAEHIRVTWNDGNLAYAWEVVGTRIDRVNTNGL